MTARRTHALALRKHSLDMVPEGAYWRDFRKVEAKVDWQKLEADEGETIEAARIGIALALTLQMQDVITRVTDPMFRLRSSVVRLDTSDVETAFARLAMAAYFDGAATLHNSLRRSIPGYSVPDVGLTAAGTQSMIEGASRRGRQFARAILDGIQLVLDSAMQDGRTTDQIVREIQSRYSQFIDLREAPQGRLLAARVNPKTDAPKVARRTPGRRMKVANREQYEQWQRQYLPFSRRMRQTLDGYLQEARVPALTAKQAEVWVQTEYTRAAAHGAIQEALTTPEVVQMEYVSARDNGVCPVCRDRDGTVRPKGDDFWFMNTPPMHPRCRCVLVPITKDEREPVTPKKELPDPDDVSPGWGGFDPNRVRTMRKLGRAIR